MQDNQADPGRSIQVLPLCDAYKTLDGQRIDLDRRLTALPPGDSGGALLWDELEAVLAKLSDVVDRLASASATRLAELKAKAAVLLTLLRSGDAGRPLLPERKMMVLVLSLTDDIAGLPG
jgi:hypothetical protein